ISIRNVKRYSPPIKRSHIVCPFKTPSTAVTENLMCHAINDFHRHVERGTTSWCL
ncbi:hypothetical protein P692DRAFT_20836539, partial [Suillus brevipes Sb2]